MPAGQAPASSGALPESVPMSSPRRVSITGVIGWCSAKPASQSGSVSTGTNALDRYGRNSRMNPYAFAASGLEAASPIAANREVIARMYSATSPIAASHSSGVALGRKPTRSATATTTPVANRLRSTLATTCPVSTALARSGMVRNRSMMPVVMSRAT